MVTVLSGSQALVSAGRIGGRWETSSRSLRIERIDLGTADTPVLPQGDTLRFSKKTAVVALAVSLCTLGSSSALAAQRGGGGGGGDDDIEFESSSSCSASQDNASNNSTGDTIQSGLININNIRVAGAQP